MNRGNDPLVVGGKPGVVEMEKVGGINVRGDFTGGEVKKAHPFGVEVHHVELGIFLGKKADHFAVMAPKGFPSMIGQLPAMTAINIHHPETAHGFAAFALVHGEANL